MKEIVKDTAKMLGFMLALTIVIRLAIIDYVSETFSFWRSFTEGVLLAAMYLLLRSGNAKIDNLIENINRMSRRNSEALQETLKKINNELEKH